MDILLFGIAREIVKADRLSVPVEAGVKTVSDLRAWLHEHYPQFKGLSSLAVAVNNEYAENDRLLESAAEIALIPPVSGG